ncbi:bifunctional 2-polyprenyl-6-hydroxyphenol methylase/3-demethylubiquinol 3-O-methyltransferase UbiG [Stappia sp. TSB10P1A]|uniref:class I SAM-dependent methyltransferase n=1 Tax=Stappia sp. TSB10P1A TaxID=2003585 RepID=UPI001FCA6638|nr:methyltransferase domain-containing protein [Stappia sp. TSB10P1A]
MTSLAAKLAGALRRGRRRPPAARRPQRTGTWSQEAVLQRIAPLPLRDRFLAEFDPDYYRALYPDLVELENEALAAHYRDSGRMEGRVASPLAARGYFVDALQGNERSLELGAFHRPLMRGAHTKHFDVLPRAQLVERAKAIGENPDGIPNIDFVSPSGDLAVVDEQFDMVVSSHVIEHQPNLVAHLAHVERILDAGGVYAMIIPDCRFCFDHFIPPSTLGQVIEAHRQNPKVHTLRSVIEMRALTTHNDAARHWKGDHGTLEHTVARTRNAIQEWEQSKGAYIDVHAWRFTPESFTQIITTLNGLGLIGLVPYRVYPTPYLVSEFCAVLGKAT